MDNKALEIVRNYINEHLDKSDPSPDFDVYTVWKAKSILLTCQVVQAIRTKLNRHALR